MLINKFGELNKVNKNLLNQKIKIMTFAIFLEDEYIGMFVCDTEKEAKKEMARLKKINQYFYLVKQ